MIDEEGKIIVQEVKKVEPKKNENGYSNKPINSGYQSHFTLGISSNLFFISYLISLFFIDEEGKIIVQEIKKVEPKKNENGYSNKPINSGYQSHFTLGIFS